jgi:hypothetical protein
LSNDLEFEEKYWDVVGLYLNPPQNAVVLCCDEKSQCQALERTQTGLPLGVGHIRTRTHDYYRHGTVTLFAALDYLSGKVLAHAAQRHRHNEWLAFLKKIDACVAPDKEIHIICDNYATHKHPRVKAWLARKKRLHLHLPPPPPTNPERFFGEITQGHPLGSQKPNWWLPSSFLRITISNPPAINGLPTRRRCSTK